MANVTVHKENPTKETESRMSTPTSMSRWEPYRWIRNLMNWDPFQQMTAYPNFPAFESKLTELNPSFEIKETKEGYMFKADVPGIKEADLDVSISGNRLTISGKRNAEKQEQSETYYAYECSYGSFCRSFTLPDGVDTNRIMGDLKDGVLTLIVPKMPEVQPKKIAIKGK